MPHDVNFLPEGPAAPPTPLPPRRRVSGRDIDAMRSLVSASFSEWSASIEVTQTMIDQFAALSGDRNWIHVDVARAQRDSPFGTTIAHGILVQALATRLKLPIDYEVVDIQGVVNIGSDRLRFVSPVPAGSRIHGRYRIQSVQALPGGVQVAMLIHTHVVGQERPAVINELLMRYLLAADR